MRGVSRAGFWKPSGFPSSALWTGPVVWSRGGLPPRRAYELSVFCGPAGRSGLAAQREGVHALMGMAVGCRSARPCDRALERGFRPAGKGGKMASGRAAVSVTAETAAALRAAADAVGASSVGELLRLAAVQPESVQRAYLLGLRSELDARIARLDKRQRSAASASKGAAARDAAAAAPSAAGPAAKAPPPSGAAPAARPSAAERAAAADPRGSTHD